MECKRWNFYTTLRDWALPASVYWDAKFGLYVLRVFCFHIDFRCGND